VISHAEHGAKFNVLSADPLFKHLPISVGHLRYEISPNLNLLLLPATDGRSNTISSSFLFEM